MQVVRRGLKKQLASLWIWKSMKCFLSKLYRFNTTFFALKNPVSLNFMLTTKKKNIFKGKKNGCPSRSRTAAGFSVFLLFQAVFYFSYSLRKRCQHLILVPQNTSRSPESEHTSCIIELGERTVSIVLASL